MKAASVYVMGSDLGLVKIGRSRQPEKRLKVITAASGAVVRLEHASPPDENAAAIEAAAHRLLNGKRRGGEWFDVTVADAVAAIAEATAIVEANRVVRGPRKVPVTFKCDPDLLREVEEFRRGLAYPLTLTGFIESAMRRELDLSRDDGKRGGRR